MRVAAVAAALAALAVPAGSSAAGGGTSGREIQEVSGGVWFTDATEDVGIDFVHVHGATGKYYTIETMGSGVALADLDRDGWIDAYFVQQGPTPEFVADGPILNRHFRNRADGHFEDVTAAAGLADDGYGMGVAAGDYDNDGFLDLYVTNVGANRLYRNNGDGTFSELGERVGVADELWGSSTAWGDLDNDGDLDLYLTNYVDWGYENNRFCGDVQRNLPAYCHPDIYNALPDRIYRNEGDGTFAEVGEQAGVADTVEGKGLGVVMADYDHDGDLDVYVANDATQNFLYVNMGDGTFTDEAFFAGVGFNEDGRTESGMGTDWGDFNGDGNFDVVVTNLTLETNTVYRNTGEGNFFDESFNTGMGEPSLMMVGFGINWVDVDSDGDLDLFVANGHIIDNIEEFKEDVMGSALENRTYAQVNHLFVNDGSGIFEEVHARAGDGMALVRVSRGSAIGDVDNDGDPDLVVTNNNQRADYLRNDTDSSLGNWIQLLLVGRRTSRTAAGARIEVTPAGGARQVHVLKVGSSYVSSSDERVPLGIGTAQAADVQLTWLGGGVEELGELEANRLYLVHEGRGVIASRPAIRR